jgi:hypothetical protein
MSALDIVLWVICVVWALWIWKLARNCDGS